MTEQHSWNHLLALILHRKKLQSLAQPWTTWSTCLALRKSIMGYQWKNWGEWRRHLCCTDGKSQEEWNTIKRHLVCQRYFDFTPHELQFLCWGEETWGKNECARRLYPELAVCKWHCCVALHRGWHSKPRESLFSGLSGLHPFTQFREDERGCQGISTRSYVLEIVCEFI